MDADGPMLDPGDQKVVGQGFASPSSRTANRIYFFLSLGVIFFGIGCILIAEPIAGVVMISVGVIASFLFARAELSERAMLRRMRRRAERSSHE